MDLPAMTKPPYNPAKLRQNTYRSFGDLLACGVDPAKSNLLVQSLVPEHTELSWIPGCVSSYGDLTRQTQFKNHYAQLREGRFVSAGLFNYPVLQAADILMHRFDFVPVGTDQVQHLEMDKGLNRSSERSARSLRQLSSTIFKRYRLSRRKKMGRRWGL